MTSLVSAASATGEVPHEEKVPLEDDEVERTIDVDRRVPNHLWSFQGDCQRHSLTDSELCEALRTGTGYIHHSDLLTRRYLDSDSVTNDTGGVAAVLPFFYQAWEQMPRGTAPMPASARCTGHKRKHHHSEREREKERERERG